VSFRKRLEEAAREHLSPQAKRRIRRLGAPLRKCLGVAGGPRLARARASFTAGDYESVAADLAAVLERRPADPEALGLTSRVAMRRGAISASASWAAQKAQITRSRADWVNARHIGVGTRPRTSQKREKRRRCSWAAPACPGAGRQVVVDRPQLPSAHSRYEEVDTELRRSMAGLADRVHLMNPRSRELVAPWFDVPQEKVIVVPHPSYNGGYLFLPREQARLRLGISQTAVVFLLVGAIKPYKGLTELLDAFDELSHRDPGRFVLLVAGQPDNSNETRRFATQALTHPPVYASLRRIPDEKMQVYLRAADIGVFSYRRSLNSGALALNLTFGLPVVLPTHSGEATAADSTYMEVYADSPDGLLRALSAAPRLVRRGTCRRARPQRAGPSCSGVRDVRGGSTAVGLRPASILEEWFPLLTAQ
jgi:glycosyltransferase involved in cell wall biosynthesis